jgi:hypothetical protein
MKPLEHQCFTLWITPRPGLTLSDELDFVRRLEDYLRERELEMTGGPLHTVVSSASRSLTATDQVDLIVGLVRDPVVERVAVSPLLRSGSRPAEREAGYIEAPSLDVPVIALTILYGCGRVSAEMVLQILGGFVRPAVVH